MRNLRGFEFLRKISVAFTKRWPRTTGMEELKTTQKRQIDYLMNFMLALIELQLSVTVVFGVAGWSAILQQKKEQRLAAGMAQPPRMKSSALRRHKATPSDAAAGGPTVYY